MLAYVEKQKPRIKLWRRCRSLGLNFLFERSSEQLWTTQVHSSRFKDVDENEQSDTYVCSLALPPVPCTLKWRSLSIPTRS